MFRSPSCPEVYVQQFVVLFQDFSESGKVKILVVLQQDQAQIKLTERQLQLLDLTNRDVLLAEQILLNPVQIVLFLFRAFLKLERFAQFRPEVGKFTGCFGKFF